eukprot:3936838-Rhodomonas_salina.3
MCGRARTRAHSAVGRLVSARKVEVLSVHRHKPHVDVLEEGVIVGSVGGDGEEARLLDMNRPKEEVDGVLHPHGASQEPSLCPQLFLIQPDRRSVLSDLAVQDRRGHHSRRGRHSNKSLPCSEKVSCLEAASVNAVREAVFGLGCGGGACVVFGINGGGVLSKRFGDAVLAQQTPPAPVTAEVRDTRVEGSAEAAGSNSDRQRLDHPVRGSVVADAARKLGRKEAVEDGVGIIVVVRQRVASNRIRQIERVESLELVLGRPGGVRGLDHPAACLGARRFKEHRAHHHTRGQDGQRSGSGPVVPRVDPCSQAWVDGGGIRA